MFVLTKQAFPPTCYVAEVAYWLAFGRIPDFRCELGEHVDERMGEEHKSGGSMVDYDDGYSQEEFLSIGETIDFERYMAGRWRTGGRTGAEYIAHMEEFHAHHFSTATWDIDTLVLEKIRAKARREAIEVDWAIEAETPFIPFVDAARSTVFTALASGKLKAVGWRKFCNEEERNAAREACDDEDLEGCFVDIPAREWSLRLFKWEESELTTRSGAYRAIQVKTDEMLQLFPFPHCEPLPVQVVVYPGAGVYVDGGDVEMSKHHASTRPRGRPAKANGAIKSVVQNYFSDRVRRGDVKAESMVQDVIDFVQLAFRETIGRTTAQSYLAGCGQSEMPENLPEIPAGK